MHQTRSMEVSFPTLIIVSDCNSRSTIGDNLPFSVIFRTSPMIADRHHLNIVGSVPDADSYCLLYLRPVHNVTQGLALH